MVPETTIKEQVPEAPLVDKTEELKTLLRGKCKYHLSIDWSAVSCILESNHPYDPTFNNNEMIRLACSDGQLVVVQKLLTDIRVDPSAKDNSAIKVACMHGDLAIVQELLKDSRVDPSANNNWSIRTACIYCLRDQSVYSAIVHELLKDSRVDPSAENNDAIIWAARKGCLPIVQELLKDSRVDPSAENNTAIIWAVRNEHFEVVRELLKDSRVNPSTKNPSIKDDCPIRLACSDLDDHVEVVNPSAGDNCVIRWASNNKHVKLVKQLLCDPRLKLTLGGKITYV